MIKKNRSLNFLAFLMPTIGASVHIIQKFLFECKSIGSDGLLKKFQKPFFFTWLGSLSLFMTYIANFKTLTRGQFCNSSFLRKPFLQIALATFLNLSAGILSNVTSLYLNYSVSLMLRSSTLVFGAIINVYYLHRPLPKYQLYSVLLTIFAIFFVGLAALFSNTKTTHREASSFVIGIIIVIRILSKSLQAISMIIEEKVMSSYSMTPVEMTGLSGVWNIFFSSVVLILVSLFSYENLNDTFVMLLNSKTVFWLSFLSVVVFGVWTVLSLNITRKASAVARMVFDQLTIVFVWIVQLGIHWCVSGNPSLEQKYGRTGEAWTRWSWLQLFGFMLMVVGACIYQKIIRLPGIDYYEYENLMGK